MPYQKAEVVVQQYIDQDRICSSDVLALLAGLQRLVTLEANVSLLVPVAVGAPDNIDIHWTPAEEKYGDLRDAMGKAYARQEISKAEYSALIRFMMVVNHKLISGSVEE